MSEVNFNTLKEGDYIQAKDGAVYRILSFDLSHSKIYVVTVDGNHVSLPFEEVEGLARKLDAYCLDMKDVRQPANHQMVVLSFNSISELPNLLDEGYKLTAQLPDSLVLVQQSFVRTLSWDWYGKTYYVDITFTPFPHESGEYEVVYKVTETKNPSNVLESFNLHESNLKYNNEVATALENSMEILRHDLPYALRDALRNAFLPDNQFTRTVCECD